MDWPNSCSVSEWKMLRFFTHDQQTNKYRETNMQRINIRYFPTTDWLIPWFLTCLTGRFHINFLVKKWQKLRFSPLQPIIKFHNISLNNWQISCFHVSSCDRCLNSSFFLCLTQNFFRYLPDDWQILRYFPTIDWQISRFSPRVGHILRFA